MEMIRNPKRLDLLKDPHVIFGDALGQKPAEYISLYYILLCLINKGNIYKVFVLLIVTLDNMKIQTSSRLQFLTSKYITSCFKMALLRQLVFWSEFFYHEAESIVQNDHVTCNRKTDHIGGSGKYALVFLHLLTIVMIHI